MGFINAQHVSAFGLDEVNLKPHVSPRYQLHQQAYAQPNSHRLNRHLTNLTKMMMRQYEADADSVYLWLGANVMLEYKLEEAKTLLVGTHA